MDEPMTISSPAVPVVEEASAAAVEKGEEQGLASCLNKNLIIKVKSVLKMFKFLVLFALLFVGMADFNFDPAKIAPVGDKEIVLAALNSTTGGPYTYSQAGHHFYGTGYDGSYIDTTGCCCGQSGSCRNNPSCQCQVSVGPLPKGTYTLGNMMTFKGMPYCYELYPSSSNSMCGRSGFLIHGGGCGGNPSEGCIVIESEATRYKIKSGATLKVVG